MHLLVYITLLFLFVAEREPRGNGDRQFRRGDLLEGWNENEEEEDRGRRR